MTEQVLDRQQKLRLTVLRHAEEVSGNVAATCRYYGITRQTFYTWQKRFDSEGIDGSFTATSTPRSLSLRGVPEPMRTHPGGGHGCH